MEARIYNPMRMACESVAVAGDSRFIAKLTFACEEGGSVTISFDSPNELRSHATAMILLAASLEENQGPRS